MKNKLSALPGGWMIFGCFALWLAFGCIPMLLVYFGDVGVVLGTSSQAAVAGTIGDAFGLANSFFSGAALLFVVWSIRVQQQEMQDQAKLMKQAASLTAIDHIYTHYSNRSQDDLTGV